MSFYTCNMCVCVSGWGWVYVYGGVFVVEVVRGGSGKLIDGNRMFYGVARERKRESLYRGSVSLTHTHMHTHIQREELHGSHIPHTHVHVSSMP